MSEIVQHSSESVEWYSPEKILVPAQEVLGGIELDPASCELANKVVKAERFFTKEDDGLARSWEADSLFLNPPYGWHDYPGGTPRAYIWTQKLIEEYERGCVKEAILLVKAAIETEWFEPLWDRVICFPKGRVNFWREDGGTGAPHASAVVYFGEHPGKFVSVFKKLGRIPLLVTGIQGPSQQRLFAA